MIRLTTLALCLFPFAALAELPSQDTWSDARQSLTTAEGLTMTYVEAGNPAGPPTLLLHGYTDNSRSWSLLAPHLANRRLIMLDLRGHGGTAAPACCYGPDSLAHDVALAMDALGLPSADVIGHSMGSVTAATLAAWHPEKVRRLVL
nr:alpha/beta hydrolase [Paracoccaceae bacterium]